MKRFRDGEFRTQREEPKNPKSKNLFWAEELSLAEEIRVGHPKNSLASFFLSFLFFSFLSFFLSFFLQIKVRQRLYV